VGLIAGTELWLLSFNDHSGIKIWLPKKMAMAMYFMREIVHIILVKKTIL